MQPTMSKFIYDTEHQRKFSTARIDIQSCMSNPVADHAVIRMF